MGSGRWRAHAFSRKRRARLSQAGRRIYESFDLDTAPNEVLKGARMLTGAHYRVLATFDNAGSLSDFRTTGLAAEECRALIEIADSGPFVTHIRLLDRQYPPGPRPGRRRGYGRRQGARATSSANAASASLWVPSPPVQTPSTPEQSRPRATAARTIQSV